jgi:penicillin-binding protein 1C
VVRIAWALGIGLALIYALDRLFPPPVPDRSRQAVVVLARDETPLRAFPDRTQVWRHPVGIDDVSPRYLEALIAYEDRQFWIHPGVNPFALMRAAWQRVSSGRIVSGGSTLTMQVARLIEHIPRSVPGKLKQCIRALQLEARYSKHEILTLYLNYAPMGGVIEGVEAASRAYLGKPASRLTHAEAALLAVLPQAPTAYRPDRRPEAARAARDKVLRRMSPQWGTAVVVDAMKEAAYAPLVRPPLLAPLLAERVRKDVPDRARIETTIDSGIQQSVEMLLLDRAAQLPPRVSIATLVVDNATLDVLAYAGSADFGDRERFSHVDMVQASRSPGSALKPFLYAFALDDGLIHSESLLSDVPQSFGGYQPGNFQQSFSGPVSVAEALTRSLNVPAVEVLDRLGTLRFASLLRRGGLALQFPRDAAPNLSVILGGAGVTLEQLTGAYTALARNGVAGQPRLYRDAPLQEARMMSEGAAFIVRAIMEAGSPVDHAVNSSGATARRIAWKTGTSFGFRDAWAVGVTDRYTVGVWVGRPDGTPNPGHFGANVAAPLLVDVFGMLPDADAPSTHTPPASVTQAPICWPLGTRYHDDDTERCHVRRTAWIINDTVPPTFPDKLRPGEPRYVLHLQGTPPRRVAPDCANGTMRRVDAVRWPTALEPWLEASLRDRVIPPAWAEACRTHARAESAVRIAGTSNGAILHRAGDVAPIVRFEARGHVGALHWMINGSLRARTVGSQSYTHRFDDAGRFEITAFDDHGAYDRITVSVR